MNHDAHPRLVRVFIAIGSNLNNPHRQVTEAMNCLQGLSNGPMRRSSLWQTTPVDCPPGSPPFINAVVELALPETQNAEALLDQLQNLERQIGRRPKTILNEPRPIDLDLIVFGQQILKTPRLALPHPRAHQRPFVLEPLAELAPELILPGQSKTIAQLLEELPRDINMRKLDPLNPGVA
jgi:2-amino-4-hydroxy-6-hydroxymethyldihydropteridine diphosphokinase